MEDGVNGVPTRLVREHVEEEYSGEQGLVQIHGISEKSYSQIPNAFCHVFKANLFNFLIYQKSSLTSSFFVRHFIDYLRIIYFIQMKPFHL